MHHLRPPPERTLCVVRCSEMCDITYQGIVQLKVLCSDTLVRFHLDFGLTWNYYFIFDEKLQNNYLEDITRCFVVSWHPSFQWISFFFFEMIYFKFNRQTNAAAPVHFPSDHWYSVGNSTVLIRFARHGLICNCIHVKSRIPAEMQIRIHFNDFLSAPGRMWWS